MSRQRRWHPPPCSSGKVAYRTQGRGLRAIQRIRAGFAQSPVEIDSLPVGVYRCGCGAWHMTSTTMPGTVTAP